MNERDRVLELIRATWQSALDLARATTAARGVPDGTRHGLVAAGCIAVEDAIKAKIAEVDAEMAR